MNAMGKKRVFRRILSVVLALAMTFTGMVSGSLQITQADEAEHAHVYDEKGFCTVEGCTEPYQVPPSGDGSRGNPYKIYNAGQLYYFAARMNGSYSYLDESAKLMADIVINDDVTGEPDDGLRTWSAISPMYYYSGTFDGNNHTISGLYIDESGGGTAMFQRLSGTIKNLGIVNSYIYGSHGVASLVYYNNGMVENCYSTATVRGKTSILLSGLVMTNLDMYGRKGTIKNSYFGGRIICDEWRSGYSDFYGIVAPRSASEADYEGICENCYYLQGEHTIAGCDGVAERTSKDFASGRVAYELNGDQSNVVFGQILSGEAVEAGEVQAYPVLNGKRVVRRGTGICPNKPDTDRMVYFNGTADEVQYTYPNHNCDVAVNRYYCNECGQILEHVCVYENGFCKYCDSCEKPEGNGSAASPFEIDNAGKLYYLAGRVNHDKKICKGNEIQLADAHAKLTDDIVVNDTVISGRNDSLRQWPVLKSYTGTFDGNYHTVSGLYVYGEDKQEAGFIGSLMSGGTVKNLGIVNSYFHVGDGDNSVKCSIGSIAASMGGGTVENCYSSASLEAGDDVYAGGLVGKTVNCDGNIPVIKNSYFAGTIQGEIDVEHVFGGVSGYSDYDFSEKEGTFEGRCEHCYYVSDISAGAVREGVAARTREEFASGQVACELNAGQSAPAFGQILDGESVADGEVQTFPVLGGRRVYEIVKKMCPGVSDEAATVLRGLGYTNQEEERYLYEYENHNYDSDGDGLNDVVRCLHCGNVREHEHVFEEGVCKYCGLVDEPQGDGTSAKPYQIGNASQLKWYAAKLNAAKAAGTTIAANAQLTGDIFLNPEGTVADSAGAYYWDKIERYPEEAVFDGQGHSIYGLCYKGNDGFGFVEENRGVIRNVILTGVSVELCEDTQSGAVCVYNYGGRIEAVTVSGVITVEDYGDDSSLGGICGYNAEDGVVELCSNYAAVSGKSSIGGIAGENDGIVRNCCNYGEITGSILLGGICGYLTGEISKCFNMADVTAENGGAGGIVGYLADVQGVGVRYCFNTGKVSMRSAAACRYMYIGAIAGVSDVYAPVTAHCYYLKGSAQTGLGFYCTDDDMYEEIVKVYGEEEGIEQKQEDTFTKGEIIWLLNKAAEETWLVGTDDKEVALATECGSGLPVSRKALFGCSGCTEPISAEYVCGGEDENSYRYKVHNYDATTLSCTECGKVLPHLCIYGEDSYCKICHGIRKPAGNGTRDKPYEIGNAAELYWFAGVVNADEAVCRNGIDKNVNACAVLTDDIVLNEETLSEETTDAAVWVPIGILSGDDWDESIKTDAYRGSFDGQGHTISGIYVPRDADGCSGFFGVIGYQAQVKHVNLDNVYICGSECAGGICNYTEGRTLIEGCSVDGTIKGFDVCAGISSGVDGKVVVRGCSNTAKLTGRIVGGIVGYQLSGRITGCYNAALVPEHSGETPYGIVGEKNSAGCVVSACYYLADGDLSETAGEMPSGYGEAATEAEFASGQIAYKMNAALHREGCTSGYGQILTGDASQKFPVWLEETTVYAVGTVSCPGVDAVSGEGYSNDSAVVEYVYKDHLYVENSYNCVFCGKIKEHTCEYVDGCCKYCSGYTKPEGEGTKEMPYRIGSAAELFWFRDKVSGDLVGEEADPAACAVLTSDIDVCAYAESVSREALCWTPVGVSKKSGTLNEYQGSFDGQGYRISGVAVTAVEPDTDGIGIFGIIGERGCISNLHIRNARQTFGNGKGTNLQYDDRLLGAFCRMNKGVVSGCSIDVEVTVSNRQNFYVFAGFAGKNEGVIANSMASGLIEATTNQAYCSMVGFCGYNEGSLDGCSSEMDISSGYEASGICGTNAGSIERCCNSGNLSARNAYSEVAGICVDNIGTIENCWNCGELSADSAGICYCNSNRVAYCFNLGKVRFAYVHTNAENAELLACYGLSGKSEKGCWTNRGNMLYCEMVSMDVFKSGAVTYMLNDAQGKTVFGQVLYETDEEGNSLVSPEAVEAYPVPGSKEVYPVGGIPCPGACILDGIGTDVSEYTNRTGDWMYIYPEHCYYADYEATVPSEYCFFCKHVKREHTCVYENGICKTCGWFEAPEGEGTKNRPYEIKNAGQLCYFARIVESGSVNGSPVSGNAAACAVLMADINLADVPEVSQDAVTAVSGGSLSWSPVGAGRGVVYEGTFDGNGYSILGMSGRGYLTALFGRTGKLAVVKNVMLTGCDVRAFEAAGISFVNEGTIEDCMVSGKVEASDTGFDMVYTDMTMYYKFLRWTYAAEKLYGDYLSFVAGENYLAGGISVINEGTIRNCYVDGMVEGQSGEGICPAGFICTDNTDGTVENCYYRNVTGETGKAEVIENAPVAGKGMGAKDREGQTEEITQEMVASGKVAWMLDTGNSFEGNRGVWRQNTQTPAPTLASKDAVTVYYLSVEKLDKTTQEYYVPAGAELAPYLHNTEGAKWVFSGGVGELADGTLFMDTVMCRPVISINEALLPTGCVTVGTKSWSQFVQTGATIRQVRGTVAEVTADRPDTKIAYYVHKADSVTACALTLEELMKKSFTAYDAKTGVVLNETGCVAVYVRLTGANGLVNYICTDGMVVEDSKNPTPSPAPTSSAEVSSSPVPTSSAEVTSSPAPISSAEVSSSPIPTSSAEVTPSPAPTSSAEVSSSPAPTSSAEVTPSPAPTSSAEVSPLPTGSTHASPAPSEIVMRGDADGNGKIELADAQLALKAALKIVRLDAAQAKAADVDGNGRVELADAQRILKYALKIIKTFD